ncbi:hypothetical protein HYH03_016215 [Edaphochlamys debaryana]|uniref:Ricin B lectin domain-containing protein n=1 Tax=Edaphochlamys debaryana TaxID=47281 RepID=A0A835XHY5_9CHLO|nr:hypothetical protein HYH03_016215 [Edaphochlamys debaryana]|eukprot:KAG2485012.1 hypothetical protein HYH03_016215 [Edaphochlamys debaryana]
MELKLYVSTCTPQMMKGSPRRSPSQHRSPPPPHTWKSPPASKTDNVTILRTEFDACVGLQLSKARSGTGPLQQQPCDGTAWQGFILIPAGGGSYRFAHFANSSNCMQMDKVEVGAPVGLAECEDGSELQLFSTEVLSPAVGGAIIYPSKQPKIWLEVPVEFESLYAPLRLGRSLGVPGQTFTFLQGPALPPSLEPESAHFDARLGLSGLLQAVTRRRAAEEGEGETGEDHRAAHRGDALAEGARGQGARTNRRRLEEITQPVLWADVSAWRGGGRRQALSFQGDCWYDSSEYGAYGSIALDGRSCYMRLKTDLPNWDSSGSAAFTVIIIYKLNAEQNALPPYGLVHIGRSPSNQNKALLFGAGDPNLATQWSPMGSNDTYLYDNGKKAFEFYGPEPRYSSWLMDAIVRKPGGKSGQAYIWYKDDGFRPRWEFQDQEPIGVRPDNLVVGADYRTSSKYLLGNVAVVLMYNRALSSSEMTKLYASYAPRFGWDLSTL